MTSVGTSEAVEAAARAAGELGAKLGWTGELELVRAGSACGFWAGELFLRVAAVGTPVREVARQAVAATRLSEAGVAVPGVVEPAWLSAEGLVVAAWEWVESSGREIGAGEVGVAMAGVHRAGVEGMEEFNVLGVTRRRVARCAELTTPGEQQLLERALEDAERLVEHVCGAVAFVHGDLHAGNILAGEDGLVVIDLENAGWGNPVWDLVMAGGVAKRMGPAAEEAYRELSHAYREAGGSVRLDEVDELQPVVDLRGTAWCVLGQGLDERFVAEAKVRLATLAGEDLEWTPL